MSKIFYFDTSIWLDIHEKRGYNGKVAKQLMKKIILESHIIIYSNFIDIEFKKLGYSRQEINKIYNLVGPSNKKTFHVTKDQFSEGRKIAIKRNIPLGDVIHAIIARDNEAQLITRDHDFSKIKGITKPKLPEDLL